MKKYICKFCGKVCKSENSLKQHEIRCKHNSNRIKCIGNPYSKGHKGSNQYIKAKELGLPKPQISSKTRKLISKNQTRINLERTQTIKDKISETQKKNYLKNLGKHTQEVSTDIITEYGAIVCEN